MPCLRLISCLVLLVACGGGGGSSDGTADGSTSAASTSTASATDSASTTVTGSGTTEAGSEPMTTTGPGETSATATTVGETSTGTPGSTSDPGTGSTGDATTGGSVGACKAIDGDYGPCDALIGYAFVDGGCQLVSGCNCEPDCEFFFDDPVACASTCAAAGECQSGNIHGGGIAPDEVGPGSFCDGVDTCVDLPELAQQLKELFPELVCEQGQCDGQNCHLLWQGELTAEQWTQICAASLLPGVDEVVCMVFGP